jgi:TM2 domain-containing membrane protein YozV
MNNYNQMSSVNYNEQIRDKNIATLLAVFLGWTGVHKFYLGKIKLGVLYAVFSFTFIPFFLSMIDFFVLVTMRQEEFDDKYNGAVPFTTPRNWKRDRKERRLQRRGNTIVFEKKKPSQQSGRPPADVTYRTSIPRVAGLMQNKAYQEGIKFFDDYQYRNAQERFQAALLINRDHSEILFRLACCNSLLEQKEDMFSNMEKAIKNGFKDFDKIQTMDALAYLRIQPEFDEIKASGYLNWNLTDTEAEVAPKQDIIMEEAPQAVVEEIREPLSTDELLAELKKLGELRQKGELTEEQFAEQKQKLFA